MTLVLGYADKEIGFLVADSLLTPAVANNIETGPVAGQFHGLKIQIIHPTVAIAYASRNDADGALKLITNLSGEVTRGDIENIPARLHAAHQKTIRDAVAEPPDSEFLVLQITGIGKTLTHVTGGGVRQCSRAYIGDPVEYKKLKSLPDSYVAPTVQTVIDEKGTAKTVPITVSDGAREFAAVSDAMETLVHQRRGSVGAIAGCVIRVVDARISKTLEYMQASEVSKTPWEGESGFSLLASNANQRGIGIYYRSGKMGFILKVGDAEHVRKERAETIQDFVQLARDKYQLHLEGGMWN